MKKHFLAAIFIATAFFSHGQQNSKLQKKIEKAESYIDAGNYSKADKLLVKLIDDYPTSGTLWDLLSKTHLYQYYDARKDPGNFSSFSISTTDEDGNVIENDSLTIMFMNLLNARSPEKMAFSKAKHTMRQATIHTNDAYMSSIYIRSYMVDEERDTGVADEAWEYFYQAEEQFRKQNFNEAAGLYQKALDIEPQFYQASLYLGDAFYHLKYYLLAAEKFNEAIKKFPNELEPRKYLMDAYFEEGLYEKAWQEGVGAMNVFPDLIIQSKLYTIARYNGKELKLMWTPRGVLPNKAPSTNLSFSNFDEKESEPVEPWTIYKAALNKVVDNCSPQGIITNSDSTSNRYLEIYSWEEMLAHSDDPILDEARRMQKLGFLDCYVFITCFHIDFYEQYLDFVAANPHKVELYYKAILDRE